MKRYLCKKEVNAVKLLDVKGATFGGLLIPWPHNNTSETEPIEVGADWIIKHSPHRQPDGSFGYYVVYDDGYTSWSPSKAFEEGYLEIVPSGDRNYLSHKWVTKLQSTPSEREYVSYCEACGCENQGDPAEFPQLEYPNCDRGLEIADGR